MLGKEDKTYARLVVDTLDRSSFEVTGATGTQSSNAQGTHAPAFGLWLPLELTCTEAFEDSWKQRYMHTQSVYERCFGPGSWGDARLIHESLGPWLLYEI